MLNVTEAFMAMVGSITDNTGHVQGCGYDQHRECGCANLGLDVMELCAKHFQDERKSNA